MNNIEFKDFIQLQRGFDLPEQNRKAGNVPIVAATSIIGYHNEVKVKAPGVVTGRSGALGEVQFINEDFWPLNTTLWVKDFKGNDPKYVYYFLKTIDFKRFNSGAGVPTLNRNDLDTLEIQIHPYEIQQKIAKILSNYDDLIENNNKRIKILEEMAQKIYKEWFVDFKYPGHETATFKDTELGKIPKGWDIKTLEEVSNVMVRGVTPEYQDGSQRYIINQKVNRGFQLALENLKELSLSLYVPEEKYAKKRDILINSLGEGTIGRIHYFNGKNNYFAVDQHMTICRFKENIAEYLYFYLSSTDGQARLSSLKTGSTNMTMLNISLLRNLKVVLPNKNLLSSYSKYIRIIFDEKNALEEKNHTLKTTRDLLLPRLMSGEIDVENLEIA